MASEQLPPDWRDLINARLEFEKRQRKLRDRRRAQERWRALPDTREYHEEYWGN
jgi:hypothetical protein